MRTGSEIKAKGFKWSSQAVSMYFSWAIMSYVVYYCTDLIGLNAGIVGTIILISKVIDAITNFIAATLVDNSHFKKGKARPWVIAIIPMWICIVLLFSIPNSWGNTAKYIMVFLMYSLINAVFATVISCVENMYLKHAFLEEKTRVSMSTIANGLGTVSMTIGMIILPMLIEHYDKVEHGWTIMTTIFAVPFALFGTIRYFTIPEADTADRCNIEEHVTLLDTIRAFFSNKYTILIMFMSMSLQVASSFGNAPTTYYFKYVVGDLSMASIVGLASIFAMAFLFFIPKLSEKIGRMRFIRVTIVIGIAANLIKLFAGSNVAFYTAASLIGAIGILPFTVLNGLMLIDSMDYDKYKNNRDLEGAVFAGTSLGTTIGSGVGTSISGVVLNLFGYDGSKAIQSASALLGIKLSISVVPTIFYLVIFVMLLFYDLDKKMPEVKAALAKRNVKTEIE